MLTSVILSMCPGLLQESFIEEPDGLVSVNLLVVSAVSAFATGAALSGLMVCWIMSLKHRQRSRASGSGLGSRRKGDKEQSVLGHGRSGSVISVTRISGSERPHSQVENLFTNGWPKSGDIDPGLPTPEQTPLQQKRPTPNVHLTDCDWDQSHTFLAQTGTPCTTNSAVIYLSSKYLQGGRQEGSGDVPPHSERQRYLILSHPANQRDQGGQPSAPPTRNSTGEYNYPTTPQESPDRRRVVSAPTTTTQTDYGEHLRWSRDGLNFNSNNATPSGHHPYPIQPRTNAALVRPGHHTQRGLNELQDYSHLLVKSVSERNPNGQWVVQAVHTLQSPITPKTQTPSVILPFLSSLTAIQCLSSPPPVAEL